MRWPVISALVLLAVVLALVLLWSPGASNVGAAGCTKVGPVAVNYLDSLMARDVKLGTMYAVPSGKSGGEWFLAARIPGSGVAVWGGDLVPTERGSDPLPVVEPQNAVAVDNWRGDSSLEAGGQAYGRSWERDMFSRISHMKPYRRVFACIR